MLQTSLKRKLMYVVIFAVLSVGYQNCGEPFGATSEERYRQPFRFFDPASYGLGMQVFAAPNSLETPLSAQSTLFADQKYQLVAGGVSAVEAVDWTKLSDTANCDLRFDTGDSRTPTLKCLGSPTASTAVSLRMRAYLAGGETREFTRDFSVIIGSAYPTPTPTGTPGFNDTVVVFRIAAGTGINSWNMAVDAVVGFVGQTLKIFNDDSAMHRLVTAGAPCASQGAPMATGQQFDCVLTSAHNDATNDISDGVAGPGARFYVRVIDGPALYQTSCAGCHSPIANSTKRGRSALSIRAAITGNVGGMGNINLTDEQLRAIAYSLSH
jgi:hypothetical protein